MSKISCILLIILFITGSTASFVSVLGPMGIFSSLFVLKTSSTYTSSANGDPSSPYLTRLIRNIDGSVNNRNNLDWGRAGWDMPRLTKAFYGDGKSTMLERGNPRELSNIIGAIPLDQNATASRLGLTMLFALYGQFIDHDLDLVSRGTGYLAQKIQIKVPKGDAFFDRNNTGNKTIEFTRSKFNTSKNGDRIFLNEVTSFLDGSAIYGSTPIEALRMREGQGRLRINNGVLYREGYGYLAGDARAAENIGLASIHTLFVRQHNRQADLIAFQFPKLNNDQVYHMARNKVIGFIQKITFTEYLPALLGQEAFDFYIGPYKGYDPSINPSINLQFATACYRIGHSLIMDTMDTYDYFNHYNFTFELKDMFLAANVIKRAEDIDFILNGMARSPCKERSNLMVNGLRNLLVETPNIIQDLFTLNVQRGRDHGMPDYHTVLKALSFEPLQNWNNLTHDEESAAKIAKAYNNDLNNIDLWVGVISEWAVPNGALGRVGTAIVAETFRRIRDGDSLWYSITYPDQAIAQIEQTTLRDIILRNTKLSNIPEELFYLPGFKEEPTPVCVQEQLQQNIRATSIGNGIDNINLNSNRSSNGNINLNTNVNTIAAAANRAATPTASTLTSTNLNNIANAVNTTANRNTVNISIPLITTGARTTTSTNLRT